MTTITITNEDGTYSVSADALTSDEYLRLFIAAMIAASFTQKSVEDAILEVAEDIGD